MVLAAGALGRVHAAGLAARGRAAPRSYRPGRRPTGTAATTRQSFDARPRRSGCSPRSRARLPDRTTRRGGRGELPRAPIRPRRLDRVWSRVPEQAQRPLAAGVVPDTRRDRSMRCRHAGHLAQPEHRISHEMNDQLSQRDLEQPILERERLRGTLPRADAGERPRTVSTNCSEGSTAQTAAGPSRLTSSAVNAPGPHPTSSTR